MTISRLWREGRCFLLNQTQNWDLVSLMQLTVFIQEKQAVEGCFFCLVFFCDVISIVSRARACAIQKTWQFLCTLVRISLSYQSMSKDLLWHKRKWGKAVLCLEHSKYIFYTSGDSRHVGSLMLFRIFLTALEVISLCRHPQNNFPNCYTGTLSDWSLLLHLTRDQAFDQCFVFFLHKKTQVL